ncbi:MAG: hypothetical protein R6U99_13460 [Nioella sp.]
MSPEHRRGLREGAYQSMGEVWHTRNDVTDLRTAGFMVSIGRVVASYRAKGL